MTLICGLSSSRTQPDSSVTRPAGIGTHRSGCAQSDCGRFAVIDCPELTRSIETPSPEATARRFLPSAALERDHGSDEEWPSANKDTPIRLAEERVWARESRSLDPTEKVRTRRKATQQQRNQLTEMQIRAARSPGRTVQVESMSVAAVCHDKQGRIRRWPEKSLPPRMLRSVRQN